MTSSRQVELVVNSSGKRCVQDFVDSILFGGIGIRDMPHVLNVVDELGKYLREEGYPESRAAELSERWLPQLRRHLETRLENWDDLGVPRPFDFLESPEETLVTWCHPNFQRLTGLRALPLGFAKMYGWLRDLSPRSLLLAGAVFLRAFGADYIAITDGEGDCGVDLIGKIDNGFPCPVFIFLQAKKSEVLLSREVLLAEHGKFLAGACSGRLLGYRRALDPKSSPKGGISCYLVLTNSEFKKGARSTASALGIMVRSRKEVALQLAESTSFEAIQALTEKWADGPPADPTKNIALEVDL